MTNPKVAVVIPNWNGASLLPECLSSLQRSSYPSLSVIVVDNASVDQSSHIVKEVFPDVRLLQLSKNLGFAGGVNVGLVEARKEGAQYLFVINNDTVVEPPVIADLVTLVSADSTIGIVGPSVRLYDNPRLLQDHERLAKYDKPVDETPMGSAFMISEAALKKVGGLDQRFFLEWEDVDLFARVREAGLRVVYFPTRGSVLHRVSSSISLAPQWFHYFYTRNAYLYYRRHRPSIRAYLNLLCVHTMSAFSRGLRTRDREAILKGLVAGTALWVANPEPETSLRDETVLLPTCSGRSRRAPS